MHTWKIIDEYKSRQSDYEAFRIALVNFVEHIKTDAKYSDFNVFEIQSRVKSIDSFGEKITRDGKDYKDPLNDITDLVGLRIIVCSIDGLNKVCNHLENIFKESTDHRVDKIDENKKNRKFGYMAKHRVVSFDKTKPGYKDEFDRFANFKAEIQVMTLLQYAWARVEHELRYKATHKLTEDEERWFDILSAVLEMADNQFQDLINKKAQEEKEAASKAADPTSYDRVGINSRILFAFFSEPGAHELFRKLKNDKFELNLQSNRHPSYAFTTLLKDCGLTNLQDVRNLLLDSILAKHFHSFVEAHTQKGHDLEIDQPGILRILAFFSVPPQKRQQLLDNYKSYGFVTQRVETLREMVDANIL